MSGRLVTKTYSAIKQLLNSVIVKKNSHNLVQQLLNAFRDIFRSICGFIWEFQQYNHLGVHLEIKF